jgi:adenylate kinase family enzyme
VHRIWVVGTSGSGKTTVARDLSVRLGIPHVELDELFWLPNWQQPDRTEFAATVVAALAGEQWVADGNYGSIGHTVLARADTVVWLDLPFRVVVWRTTRRAIRRLLTREPMWSAGNRESLRKLLGRDRSCGGRSRRTGD